MKEKQYYTYLYRDIDGTPVYVGKGTGNRAWEHIKSKLRLGNLLRKRKKQGHIIQPIINYEVDEETSLEMEKFWINFYGREDLGKGTLFNLTDGGEGCVAPSQETKAKISKTCKERGIAPPIEYQGWRLTPEQRKKQIAACQTQEYREKQSIANLKKQEDPEYVLKMREVNDAKKGKPAWNKGLSMPSPSKETIEKRRATHAITQASKPKKPEPLPGPGRGNLTPEQRAKQKAAMTGRTLSVEHKENVRKAMLGHKVDDSTKSKISQTLLLKPKLVCPHCSKTGSPSAMKHWHFDRCKSISMKMGINN